MARKKQDDTLQQHGNNDEHARACAIEFGNIPIVDAEDGWDDLAVFPIKPTQGMGLKSIRYNAPPGAQLRVRTDVRAGAIYNATVWDVTSKGIPKTLPLVGHEFGGHEVAAVKVQRRAGHQGEAILDFQMYGEGYEDAPPSNV